MTSAPIDAELLQVAEVLLTASPEPLTQARLNQVMDRRDINLSQLMETLNRRFTDQDRPVEVVAVAGGYQLVTRPEYQPYLQRLFQKSSQLALSRAALETIAVIAYRQPITKGDIAVVRGVNSESVVRTLLEKGLIAMKGRDEGIGRPLLFGTTPAFLEAFGLQGLKDLPKLKEIEEIMGADESPDKQLHEVE